MAEDEVEEEESGDRSPPRRPALRTKEEAMETSPLPKRSSALDAMLEGRVTAPVDKSLNDRLEGLREKLREWSWREHL